jgi:hypothetical protein
MASSILSAPAHLALVGGQKAEVHGDFPAQ